MGWPPYLNVVHYFWWKKSTVTVGCGCLCIRCVDLKPPNGSISNGNSRRCFWQLPAKAIRRRSRWQSHIAKYDYAGLWPKSTKWKLLRNSPFCSRCPKIPKSLNTRKKTLSLIVPASPLPTPSWVEHQNRMHRFSAEAAHPNRVPSELRSALILSCQAFVMADFVGVGVS